MPLEEYNGGRVFCSCYEKEPNTLSYRDITLETARTNICSPRELFGKCEFAKVNLQKPKNNLLPCERASSDTLKLTNK